MQGNSSALTDTALGGLTGLTMSESGGGKGIMPLLLGGLAGYGLSSMHKGQTPLAAATQQPVNPSAPPTPGSPFSRGTPDAPWSNYKAAVGQGSPSALDLTSPLAAGASAGASSAPQALAGLTGQLSPLSQALAKQSAGAGAAGAAQAAGGLGGLGALASKASPWIEGAEMLKGLVDKSAAAKTPQYKGGGFST